MKPAADPVALLYAMGSWGDGAWRGLPPVVLEAGFLEWARRVVVPDLAATGARRVVLHLPGGYALNDEAKRGPLDAGGPMSFRTWEILHKGRPLLARTMEPALDLISPLVSELVVYLGDIAASLPRLRAGGGAGGSPAAFLRNVADCLGPFAAHPKISYAVDGSSLYRPLVEGGVGVDLGELVFVLLGALGKRTYREGAPIPQSPAQWGDNGYVTDEGRAAGVGGTSAYWTPPEKLAGELIVQQPKNPPAGATWADTAWLMGWIDARVTEGFSVAVSPSALVAAGRKASGWGRSGNGPSSTSIPKEVDQ